METEMERDLVWHLREQLGTLPLLTWRPQVSTCTSEGCGEGITAQALPSSSPSPPRPPPWAHWHQVSLPRRPPCCRARTGTPWAHSRGSERRCKCGGHRQCPVPHTLSSPEFPCSGFQHAGNSPLQLPPVPSPHLTSLGEGFLQPGHHGSLLHPSRCS